MESFNYTWTRTSHGQREKLSFSSTLGNTPLRFVLSEVPSFGLIIARLQCIVFNITEMEGQRYWWVKLTQPSWAKVTKPHKEQQREVLSVNPRLLCSPAKWGMKCLMCQVTKNLVFGLRSSRSNPRHPAVPSAIPRLVWSWRLGLTRWVSGSRGPSSVLLQQLELHRPLRGLTRAESKLCEHSHSPGE